MEKISLRSIVNKALGNFAQASTETISGSTLVKNAISNNIAALNTNPKLKTIGQYPYIQFGNGDDMPQILSSLLDKSTTHSGIVRKKAKMIAGKGIVDTNNSAKWKAFIKNAGGYNVTLYSLINKASFFYERDGGFVLVLKTDSKNTDEAAMIEVFSYHNARMGKPTDGLVDHVIIRNVFKRTSGEIFSNKERKIEMFNPSKKQKEYAIHVSNPMSTNPFYGTPNYISAFDFIESDFEFGRTIKNSARNGFAPRLIAKFIGRNMSEEQKSEESAKFKTNFNGADSENVISVFVRRKEEAPEFDKLDIQNLDKTVDVMAKLNDSKILTAHSVTSPTLFGISIAGKLGGTGTELYSAFELFREMETLPAREVVLSGFQTLLSTTSFKNIELELEERDMSFLMGGNKNTGVENEGTGGESE